MRLRMAIALSIEAKSLCTDILIRLLARGYDAIMHAYNNRNCYVQRCEPAPPTKRRALLVHVHGNVEASFNYSAMINFAVQ